MIRAASALLVFFSLLASAPAPTTANGKRLDLKPCKIGREQVIARCGTFDVFESLKRPKQRLLRIYVEVVPALAPHHQAIAIIPGGPGQAASDIAPFVVGRKLSPELMKLRDRYDLVFVDLRGMGKSTSTCQARFTSPPFALTP